MSHALQIVTVVLKLPASTCTAWPSQAGGLGMSPMVVSRGPTFLASLPTLTHSPREGRISCGWVWEAPDLVLRSTFLPPS